MGPVFKFQSKWNLEVLVFIGGEKPENPEKNPWSKIRTSNKHNPHETPSTGIEPGSQRLEESAYPQHQPCSQMTPTMLPNDYSFYSGNIPVLKLLPQIPVVPSHGNVRVSFFFIHFIQKLIIHTYSCGFLHFVAFFSFLEDILNVLKMRPKISMILMVFHELHEP